MSARDLVVGGMHAVRGALARAPGDALELWLRRDRDNAQADELEAQARMLGVAVQRVTADALDRLYGDDHHQGVVLRRRAPALLATAALLERLAAGTTPALLLVLDGVQDPRNFGACLRAADGAGADA
ncbi:MAG: RNA methyltransferase substrate-binding domain-containing protein, partial [Gammaproteobacteria bacterium]